jgi:hypothetical protein
MFIGWLESSNWTGNISFDAQGDPLSLNAAFLELYDDAGDLPEFAGTCMRYSAGTRWLTTTADVVPGEQIDLVLAIFDLDDVNWDSFVLLDNVRWGCGDTPGPITDAAVSGKTLTFSLRHHDRGPAVVRAFTDAPFMAHAHPYGALMKPRRLKFGYDATLGLLTTLAGECTVAAGEWFARLRRLGMRCIDEADEGAEIADVRAFAARDHGRILEAPGMVWREARGVARIHGGNPSPDLEVLWGWPERKLRGVARGG